MGIEGIGKREYALCLRMSPTARGENSAKGRERMGGKIGDCKQRTLTVGMTGIQFDRYDSITVLPRYMGLSTTTYYLS